MHKSALAYPKTATLVRLTDSTLSVHQAIRLRCEDHEIVCDWEMLLCLLGTALHDIRAFDG